MKYTFSYLAFCLYQALIRLLFTILTPSSALGYYFVPSLAWLFIAWPLPVHWFWFTSWNFLPGLFNKHCLTCYCIRLDSHTWQNTSPPHGWSRTTKLAVNCPSSGAAYGWPPMAARWAHGSGQPSFPGCCHFYLATNHMPTDAYVGQILRWPLFQALHRGIGCFWDRVGAISSQCRRERLILHPIIFFSKKLSMPKRNYDVEDRVLLAGKLAMEEWCHWLEGAEHPFVVYTDNKNLEYLQTTKGLNPRQALWSVFFTRFHFTLSFFPG